MKSEDDEGRQRLLREALSKRPVLQVPRMTDVLPADGASDDSARREASALASGGLEAEAAKREHGRTERFRDHVAIAILFLFWLGFAILVASAVLWCVNFILPESRAFLTQNQADRIISFLTGSGVTTFVTKYAKKRLT